MAAATDYPINSTVAEMPPISPQSLIYRIVNGIGSAVTITVRFVGDSVRVIKSEAAEAIDGVKSVTVEKARKAFIPSPDTEAAVMTFTAHTKPVDWQQAAVTSCISCGIVLSTVSVEIRLVSPIAFDLMSVLTALSFSSMFVSNFVAAKHPVTAGVLWFVGLLILAAVLFIALSIHLALPVICIMWFIFGGCVVIIVIVNA